MQALYSFFQDPLENYFKLNTPINVKQPPLELLKEFQSKSKAKNFRNICCKNVGKGKLNQLRVLTILHWLLLYTEQDGTIDMVENILSSIEKGTKKQQFSVSADNIAKQSYLKTETNTSYSTATGNFFTNPSVCKSRFEQKQQILSAASKKPCNTDRVNVNDLGQNNLVKKNIEQKFIAETFLTPYKKILRKTTSTHQMFQQVRQKYWISRKLYHLFRSSKNLLYPQGQKKGIFLFNIIFYIRKMLTEIFALADKISTLGRYFLQNQTVKKSVIFFVDMLALQAVYYYHTFIQTFKSILTEDYDVCFKLCEQSQRKARRQMILSVLTEYLPNMNIEMRSLLQNKYFEPAYNSKIFTKLIEISELDVEIAKQICEVMGYSNIVQQYNYIQTKHQLKNDEEMCGTQMNLKKICIDKKALKQLVQKSQKPMKVQRRQRCLTLTSEAEDTITRKGNQKSAQNEFQAFIMRRFKFPARNLSEFIDKALDKAVNLTQQIERQKSIKKLSQNSLSKQKQTNIANTSIPKNKRRFSNTNQRQQIAKTSLEKASSNLLIPPKLSKMFNSPSKNQKNQQSFNLFSSPVKEKSGKKQKTTSNIITQLSDSIKLKKKLLTMAKYEIQKQLVIEELNTQLGDSAQIHQETVLQAMQEM